MDDITALMAKLKADVAYLQFERPLPDPHSLWPVLDHALKSPSGPAPVIAAEPAEAPAAVAHAPGASLLSRYDKTRAAAPSRALADIFAKLERKPL